MDSFKTVNVRSSTEILDFIGDLGGFNDAVTMLFAVAGAFFSSRFVTAALAKDLFMEKNKNYHRKNVDKNRDTTSDQAWDEVNKNENRRQILGNFNEIDISKFQILTDPMMSSFCFPFAYCCKCVRGFKRR